MLYTYTCPILISKFWSLRHDVYLTHANLDPPKFWSLRWVLYVTRAQPQSSIFGGLRLGIVYFIHAKPWPYNFESLGACSLFYTCPALFMSCIYTCPNKILQILELRACCIFYTCPTSKPPNFGVLSMWWILPWSPICESWGMLYMLHMPQPWPSNFLRLGHVLYYTHAQRLSSKFWSLGHAVYCILYMHNLKPQDSTVWKPMESWACGVYFTHAQPWSPQKF